MLEPTAAVQPETKKATAQDHTWRCSPIGQVRDVHRQPQVLWVHQIVARGCSWGQQVAAGLRRPRRLQASLPASTLHTLQAACQADSVQAEDVAFLKLVLFAAALRGGTVSRALCRLCPPAFCAPARAPEALKWPATWLMCVLGSTTSSQEERRPSSHHHHLKALRSTCLTHDVCYLHKLWSLF